MRLPGTPVVLVMLTLVSNVQQGLVERESPNEAARDPCYPCDFSVSWKCSAGSCSTGFSKQGNQ